jgi:hypothetical protein
MKRLLVQSHQQWTRAIQGTSECRAVESSSAVVTDPVVQSSRNTKQQRETRAQEDRTIELIIEWPKLQSTTFLASKQPRSDC